MTLHEIAAPTTGEVPGGAWRSRRPDATTVAALGSVVVLLALCVVAPILWGDQAAAYHPDAIGEPPSAEHLAGTDAAGRDIFLRVLVATRLSLGLTLAATAIAVGLGIALGTLPSLVGPRLSRALSSGIGLAVAFPSLMLAIFFATVFGVGGTGAVLALGFAGAPWFARITQTLVASMAERDFVSAARVLGVGRLRVLTRHVLPNVAEPLLLNATLAAATNLLAFAGLSFLGIGVQAPAYDWGRLLLEGLSSIYVNPWAALAPGLFIAVAGLAFNLTGELAARWLREQGTVSRVSRPQPSLTAGSAPAQVDEDVLVQLEDLTIGFPGPDQSLQAVRGVSLTIRRGEAVGMVGESGSGKSLTGLAIARLLEEPAQVRARRLVFDGHDLLLAPPRRLRDLLGGSLAVVFQNPMSSLNPVRRIGSQLAEVARAHGGLDARAAHARAVESLDDVRLPQPAMQAEKFPHQLSGGMRQRAMIGIGLMTSTRLLIADEPTTALDVTVQREILRLFARIRIDTGTALLMISHDIAVVSGACERLVVMYAGRVVEDLPSRSLAQARHPYTKALTASVPDLTTRRDLPLPTIPGRPPAPGQVVVGCAFAPRCQRADQTCREQEPVLVPAGDPVVGWDHRVACWHPEPEEAR